MARKAAAQMKEGAEPLKEDPPITGDIEVELADAPLTNGSGAVEEPIEVEPVEPVVPEPREPVEDPEKVAMRQRLQELEEAELRNQQALQQAQAAQQQAFAQRVQAQNQAFQAQYDSIVSALGSKQAELDAAKQQLKGAGLEGNWDLVADFQAQIGSASAEVSRLEAWKTEMDRRWEQMQRQQQQPPRQQQPQPQDAADIIAKLNVPDRAKQWLRQHPDYVTDPAKVEKLGKMHNVAEYQVGGQVWSDAYFNKMEELLGFRQPTGQQPATQHRQTAPVAAPPTREAPSMTTGRTTPTKVTLNKDEREIASSIAAARNISQAEAEREYAKQKILMGKKKSDGEIQ